MKKILIIILLLPFQLSWATDDLYSKLQKIGDKDEIKLNIIYDKIFTLKIANRPWLNVKLVDNVLYYINMYKYKKAKENSTIDYYKLIKVVDWNTITVLYDWKEEVIKMIWIDAPKSTVQRNGHIECYWKEAKESLTTYLSGNYEIGLEFDSTQWTRDKYNRLRAYVWHNNENINLKLLKYGYVYEYNTYEIPHNYSREFKYNLEYAKFNQLWLWDPDTCNWKK